jgi:hypothetical protein
MLRSQRRTRNPRDHPRLTAREDDSKVEAATPALSSLMRGAVRARAARGAQLGSRMVPADLDNSEYYAHRRIDGMFLAAGWDVQDRAAMN